MSFPWEQGRERQAPKLQLHLQPKVTPRCVARSNFERAASGAQVAFVGEDQGDNSHKSAAACFSGADLVSPRRRGLRLQLREAEKAGNDSAREKSPSLRDPESARRKEMGVLRRAPSCADAKKDGWDSAAEALTHGECHKRALYANSKDNPSRIRGRTERDLVTADPKAVIDALHGVHRPRVRGTGKEVRDIVNPVQVMPWSRCEAQRVFLEDASGQERQMFRRISERVFATQARQQDCAYMMRELDPRGCGISAHPPSVLL